MDNHESSFFSVLSLSFFEVAFGVGRHWRSLGSLLGSFWILVETSCVLFGPFPHPLRVQAVLGSMSDSFPHPLRARAIYGSICTLVWVHLEIVFGVVLMDGLFRFVLTHVPQVFGQRFCSFGSLLGFLLRSI